MNPDRNRIGLLTLTVCTAFVLSSCTGSGNNEAPGEAGAGDDQAKDVWGDTPGLVVHNEDRDMLFVLDPETGEEIDSLNLNFGGDAPPYGFSDSPEESNRNVVFSSDFRHMAHVTDGREKLEVRDLAEQEAVWENELESDSLSSTNSDLTWVDFSADGETLTFSTSNSDGHTLHRAAFAEGGEPEEINSAQSGSDGSAVALNRSRDYLVGEGYSHQHDGADGETIEVEGVHSSEEPMPTYVRIWADGSLIGPNEEYEDFARTEDGTYIGARIDRAAPSYTVEPDVPHLIELTIDDEGEVSEWSEIAEAGGIDAFALSPDQEQIAVSKDGDVFLLPADGSAEETRLDEDGSQDYRVLGWF